MKCADFEKYSEDYFAGELNDFDRKSLEVHIKECVSCRQIMESMQESSHLLKQISSVSPSPHFDAQMMRVYNSRFEKQSKSSFLKTFLTNFSMSKPAFSMGVLALIAFSILAFQLGKMSAGSNPNYSAQNTSEQEKPAVRIVEKIVEVPVMKTVEVPVYREKIINRVIFKDRLINKSSIERVEMPTNNNLNDTNLLTTAVNDNRNISTKIEPLNLAEYRALSEVQVKIIRKENNDKK